MIRKAVGAIVYRGDRFLLVGKVKLMDIPGGPVDIPLEWNIPSGGIRDSDGSSLNAIKRELREETGSERFEIIRELEDKLCFLFPPHIRDKTGFENQETVMFLVEYTGDDEYLTPIDEEIEKVAFVTEEEVFRLISFEETRDYFRKTLKHLEKRES
ncbi:MAG: NUDIX domain-containing protein [Candidatus Thorarchaeota archaeon]